MIKLELKQLIHAVKTGDTCPHIEPNVLEDTIFTIDGKPIGFYLRDISKHNARAGQFADIADKELRLKESPKAL